MPKIDLKLAASLASVVFVAGGAWWNLRTVSSDVAAIKTTIDNQANELTIHVAADSHIGSHGRISRIEESQKVLSEDMKTLLSNQSALCQATGARCR
jgi:hypothetical protein